jgi:hypothetical protein
VFTVGDTRIGVVAPNKMIGIRSILDFRSQRVAPLLEAGYTDAAKDLATYF